MRFIDNQSAQCYLNGDLDFQKAFAGATPFKGFTQLGKIAAFKKIYLTLRNEQFGWNLFKANFLSGKDGKSEVELQEDILKHLSQYPDDLIAKAWKLAESQLCMSSLKGSVASRSTLINSAV